MLGYLLDENISGVIAEQLVRKNPEIYVETVYRWRGGALIGQSDEKLLRTAAEERLTLVTYDLKTIPLLLSEMAADNEDHTGVLFVDDATLRSNDFGGLVNALLLHWGRYKSEDWMNRVAYLTAV